MNKIKQFDARCPIFFRAKPSPNKTRLGTTILVTHELTRITNPQNLGVYLSKKYLTNMIAHVVESGVQKNSKQTLQMIARVQESGVPKNQLYAPMLHASTCTFIRTHRLKEQNHFHKHATQGLKQHSNIQLLP